MLDFSWSHILIVLIVALVVVGPKDLPRLMRIAGQWAGKARNMANEFRRSFDEMARQAELDELRVEIEALKNDKAFTDVQRKLNEPLPTDALNAKATPVPAPQIEATPEAGKAPEPVAVSSALPAADSAPRAGDS